MRSIRIRQVQYRQYRQHSNITTRIKPTRPGDRPLQQDGTADNEAAATAPTGDQAHRRHAASGCGGRIAAFLRHAIVRLPVQDNMEERQ